MEDFLYYDENDELQFTKDILPRISPPFRKRLVLSYKRAFLVLFFGVGLPYESFYTYSFIVYHYLPMSLVHFIIGEIFATIAGYSVLFLVVHTSRFITQELNSLFDVKNSKTGSARTSLSLILTDKKEFRAIKNRFFKSFYISDKFEYVAIIIGPLFNLIPTSIDIVNRYYIRNGDMCYAFCGFANYPYTYPFPFILLPYIGGLMYGFVAALGLTLLWKIIQLIRNIIYLRKTIEVKINRFLDILGRQIARETSLENNNITSNIEEQITNYSVIWSISNLFSNILARVAFILIEISLALTIFFSIPSFFGYSVAPGTFIFKVIGITLGSIGIIIFLFPLINLKYFFAQYKAQLTGLIQDLYEKKIFHYLSLGFADRNKDVIANEITVLQEVVEYIKNLNSWPFSVPQFIRVATLTSISVILPYIFDLFI